MKKVCSFDQTNSRSPATTVSVSAATPLVDTAESSLASVVGQQTIESLPTNGRNFNDFELLTPGATTDGDFGMISFNGVAGNFNNYTVDGGNNNNAFFSQQIGRTSIPFQFSEDVIREFQVTSTGFEAEFGQSGGGLVNTVTKSGTNQLRSNIPPLQKRYHGLFANGLPVQCRNWLSAALNRKARL